MGFETPKVINVYYVDTIVVGRNRDPKFGNVRNTVLWILMIGASKLGKKKKLSLWRKWQIFKTEVVW